MIIVALTTCSFIWTHKDFFLTADMPVEKVFLMLVARRRESCEIPSRPAMEPDRTLVPPALLMNKELMIFLRKGHKVIQTFQNTPEVTTVSQRCTSGAVLTFGSPAGRWWR